METDIIGLTATTVQNLIASALAAALPPAAQIATVRPLNSAFQPSTAHDSIVTYSVKIGTTASIGSGQDGEVVLEIATDSAFTQNVQALSIFGNGQSYTLAVAIQGVQTVTGQLTGVVPASMWARLRTVNNVGTPTFTYRCGQETAT
jgi:hypothetical protein